MLYIRADANETVATGHVMRCLSIADAAKALGEDTTFILADDSFGHIIENKGYKTVVLHTPWDDMDREIEKIVAIIRQNKISKLLVDSYQVTEKYLKALSKETKIIYIDDVDSFIYPVDTLICYAAYADKFGYASKYHNTELLLGTKYVPLRQEFCRLENKKIRNKINRVLVLSGGTDKMNVLQQILDETADIDDMQTDAICGVYNPNFDALCRRYNSYKNISLHRSSDNIIDYMKSADAAISAGGTTLYELCACGVPTISYIIADNQRDNAECFDKMGLIPFAGDARVTQVGSTVRKALLDFSDADIRRDISKRMRAVVDGLGASRIARHLIG